MSLDVELILAALDKHFDAVEARWDRLFAAQDARGYQRVSSRESALSAQASTGVPDLTQFATIGDENTAVGGGLRGGGDAPSEHHLKAPIVADNWGGLFEQPAHMLEEHELTSTDEVRNSTDEIHTGSCLTSTDLDMPVYIAPAHACVAPVPASCLTSTDKDDITTSTPARCSTAGLIRGELVLAAVTAVPVPSSTSSCALGVAPAEMSVSATVSTPSLLATTVVSTFSLAPAVLGAKEEVPDEWPIKCSPDYLSIVLETLHPCSFKWSQFRYRTSYIPEIHGTQQSFKLLSAHNSLPIQPLHASLFHKGPGLFILHSHQLSIPPKPPWSLACSEYDNFNCNCATLVIWMVWLQFLVHTTNVQLRPLPWPSFSVRAAVQLEKTLSHIMDIVHLVRLGHGLLAVFESVIGLGNLQMQ